MNHQQTRHESRSSSKSTSTQASGDVIELIVADHRPIKKLLRAMKDGKYSLSEKGNRLKS